MNFINKLSDGTIERILRPDILFVKDSKTQYEEKIYKSNIVINITMLEKSILDKLSEIYKFDHNTKVINTINENTEKLMDIIEELKKDNDRIKKKIEFIQLQSIIDENIIYFLFFLFLLLVLSTIYCVNPNEFNKIILIIYNYSVIVYNQLQSFIISQFVQYKKIIQDIHNNYTSDMYDL
jgi:hypothetical protein